MLPATTRKSYSTKVIMFIDSASNGLDVGTNKHGINGCTLEEASEGRMSLSKTFPHQSRLFFSKRYDFIQSPIDLNLIIKFNVSLLI
jgi:hypothetical protein